jgi:hypothetical protein
MATSEEILGAMANALRDRNLEAVVALWRMLAVEDPDTAATLLDIVQNLPVDTVVTVSSPEVGGDADLDPVRQVFAETAAEFGLTLMASLTPGTLCPGCLHPDWAHPPPAGTSPHCGGEGCRCQRRRRH